MESRLYINTDAFINEIKKLESKVSAIQLPVSEYLDLSYSLAMFEQACMMQAKIIEEQNNESKQKS